MKSDQVIQALSCFLSGDRDRGLSYVRMIEASERQAKRNGIANQLERLCSRYAGRMIALNNAPACVRGVEPRIGLSDLILSPENRASIDKFVAEWAGRERLAAYGLAPRNVAMFSGPSGNGKTALAESLASELELPLAIARYSELIDSYRGNTGRKIAEAFKFTNENPCVLFFDEADSAVGARVEAAKDSGIEENRQTNQILMELDAMGEQSLVVFATNMPGQIDDALARRVSLRLHLAPPNEEQAREMATKVWGRWPELSEEIVDEAYLSSMQGSKSFAEIRSRVETDARELILAMG